MQDLLARYDRPAPRYTSYPTAPHFHPGVNADVYANWLGNLSPDSPVSLYMHIPFCAEMCWFCGCNTRITQRYKPVQTYLKSLRREIDHVAELIGSPLPVSHFHWGGGSPTLLSPEDFSELVARVRQNFMMTDKAEIAVEIDPRTLSPELVAAFAASGVTRASLGVQDFDPKVQEAIHRIQPYEQVKEAVQYLRDAGISAINFDLIYGLPHQSVDSLRKTVDQAVELRPDRLAVFGYAHVPWMKKHQRMIEEKALADTEGRFQQAEMIAHQLRSHGYRQIGLDHFALPGDALALAAEKGELRRNFQGYTVDKAETLIGFGASAIGACPEGYVQNATALPDYEARIRKRGLAATRGIELGSRDRERRALIERLMCDLEVDLKCFPDENFAAELEALAPMAADDLVEVTGSLVRLTERGRPFMRTVCALFDQYLGTGPGRHSRAI